jgi:hypothetical protein
VRPDGAHVLLRQITAAYQKLAFMTGEAGPLEGLVLIASA